jgi:type VI secretion system secreted protein VgrG
VYTQDNRPIRVDTTLPKDTLLLLKVSGRESISTPYSYRLEMMSEDAGIKGTDLLRQAMRVTLETNDGTRVLHGLVNRFAKVGQTEGLTFYQAEIVPWIWFLSLTRNIRIFQNVSPLTIIETIFKEAGYPEFDTRVNRMPPPRDYCVQYRESNLDFVSRLMEEEGIFYFYEHTEDEYKLVLADSNSAMPACPGLPIPLNADGRAYLREDYVRGLRHEDSVRTSAVALTDYDYLQPSLNLLQTVPGGPDEAYDWPGKYTEPADGDQYARIRLEAEEALLHVVTGGGFCRSLAAGHTFEVQMPNETLQFALLDVSFEFDNGDFRSWNDGSYDGHCEFTAIPKATKYRTPLRTPRPVVRGSQTAVVVGPGGEEIWVDKHGRVKVQFFWDREGKKDENSSCWVRFSTAWAGKGWGQISIPRIGQEVIVDFLEGDPDRPIITGRVYNAEQLVPYTLPDHQTQSGVKSRSTKGGSTETFNEIRMEDEKDKEELYIHAQKDETIMVENDRKLTVEHDETITVDNDRTKHVKRDEKSTIDRDRTEKVGRHESVTIDGNETYEVGGNRKRTVKGDETITIKGKQNVKVQGDRDTKVDGKDALKVGTTLTISAGTSITLKVGGNSIKIDNAGITIKGTIVKIQANAKAEMKAPLTTVKADGILQVKGAVSQVNGDGVLMLKGGVTMIN